MVNGWRFLGNCNILKARHPPIAVLDYSYAIQINVVIKFLIDKLKDGVLEMLKMVGGLKSVTPKILRIGP